MVYRIFMYKLVQVKIYSFLSKVIAHYVFFKTWWAIWLVSYKIEFSFRILAYIIFRNYIELGYGRLRTGFGAKTSVFAIQ